MGRGAKSERGKSTAKPAARRTRPTREKTESGRTVPARRLAEAREQQAAAAEILRVISGSPGDVQPVFEAIVASAFRLCAADFSAVVRHEGGELHLAAVGNMSAAESAAYQSLFPRPVGRDFVMGRAFVEGQPVHVTDVLQDVEYDPHALRVLQSAATYRTYLGVPILRQGRPIGAIGCGRRRKRPFTAAQIELVKTFAEQAAIAIENARLLEELGARNTEMAEALERQTATAEILQVISSSLTDVQPVFDRIARSAARFCGATDVVIMRLDGTILRGVAGVGQFREVLLGQFGSLGDVEIPVTIGSVTGRSVVERRTVHVQDLAAVAEDDFPEGRDLQRRLGHRTTVATPLLRQGAPVGVIAMFRMEVAPFSDKQLDLLRVFADQAVIAIENARLFAEVQSRNLELTESLERQTATGEILRVISGSPTDVQPVFDAIVQSATRLCDAAFGTAFRFDGRLMTLEAGHGMSPEEQVAAARHYPRPAGRDSASGRALAEGRVVHIADVREDPEYGLQAVRESMAFRTVLAVPMLRDGRPIGSLSLWRREVRPFTDQQIELVKTFADQAVIAIENVRLFKELETRNHDLTGALDRQTATAEILRAISQAQADVQPVFEAIAASVMRLFGAWSASVYQYDGAQIRLAATRGGLAGSAGPLLDQNQVPRPPTEDHPRDRTALTGTMQLIVDSETDPGWGSRFREHARMRGFRSAVTMPMLRGPDVVGVLAMTKRQPGAVTPAEVALLRTFADQAVIAIENARLLNALQARNADLTETLEQQTATSEILRVISRSPTDIQPVLDAVAESAARLCESHDTAIWRRDGDRLLLVAHHGALPVGPVGEFALSLLGTVPGRSVLDGRTVHVTDLETGGAEFGDSRENARLMGFRTVLSVPLMREGMAIGAIALRRTEGQLFSDRQVALLETFADQAVIAIENVRLFRELEARNRDLTGALDRQTATAEILRAISQARDDVRPVFEAIAESAMRLFGAWSALVHRYEDGAILLVAARGGRPGSAGAFMELHREPQAPPADHPIGRAILTGSVQQTVDAETDPAWGDGLREDARVRGFRSAVAVPMQRGGAVIGVIAVTKREAGGFTPAEIALLQTFADQAIIAIENARLLGELQARNADLTESLEQQTATSEILRVISSSPTDIQPVLDAVAETAARLCEAQDASIFRRVDERLLLVAHHGPIPFGPVGQFTLPLVRGTANGRSVLEAQPSHVADLQAETDEFPEGSEIARRWGHRTNLTVPLLRESVAIGSISLRRSEVRLFTDRQVALLRTFADQAVIAIENVRLFKELEVRNRDLTETLEQQTATGEILRAISGSPTDAQPIFDAIVRNAVRLCDGLYSAAVLLEGGLIHLVAHHNWSGEGLATARRLFPMEPTADHLTAHAVREARVVHVRRMHDDPGVPRTSRELAIAQGYQTLLVVPMLRGGQATGAIVVAKVEGPFLDAQIELLKTFADQAVIAVENVRLFRELEDRNAELTETLARQTATGEVLRVISRSQTDVQPVFDTIVRNARDLCGADSACVFGYDGELIHIESLDNASTEQAAALRRSYPMPPTQGHATGRAIRTGRPVHIPDVREDPEYVLHALRDSVGLRTLLSVPMIRDGVPIGAITVQRWGAARPFSDKQVALLQTFADQAVIAIENVRLFKELDVRNRDLTETLEHQTATSEILRVISSSPTDVQPVFDTIARNAARLCEAQFCFVYRFDGRLMHFVAHHGVAAEGAETVRRAFPAPPGRGSGAERAILDGRVSHIPDVLADPGYVFGPTATVAGYRSILAVPMLRDGQPIGAIAVARTPVGLFPDRQVELLKIFADQAVIAIENVRLFQELEARTGELTRSVGELRALGEVSQAVGSSLDLETVLATIVSRAVQLSGSYSGIVYEFDDGSQSFHARATHRISPEYVETLRAAPIRLGEGVMGRAGVTRQPVVVADIQSERQLVAPQAQGYLAREGLASLLAVPLVREERLLGGLVILRTERGDFAPEVVAMLQTFAAQSVLAMHNASLFREIQRQKQYADALVETSPVAIATVDPGGRVVGWNPGAVRLFGYAEAEALGREIDDVVTTPESRDEVRANVRQLRAGERINTIARRFQKDGTPLDVEVSTVPLVVDGADVGFIAIYHDITELLRARREAETANEAKSAFLATMSHEIRTPLNAVIGMSGLLLNTSLSDEQREYAEIVRQSGDALLTVINDILDFSKIEAGKLELESQPFDVRECVESALDLVAARAAEKGLDLAYLVGDGTPAAVMGDVTRLRQILLNLLSNAVKFTERGEVVLSVSARRVEGTMPLHELAFAVRDTGIGIPPDRRDRLFQSFSQVDASTTRRYGGTGLGLAISQRLTELMGGRIAVTSEVGAGSEFRFTIRAAAAEVPIPTRRDLSGVQPSLRGKRVLVVDDNATNRRILTTQLGAWGMPAEATASPIEALGWIEAGERFDVAILDMHMPEMDGVALARAIRTHPAGTAVPLVLFTSLGRREARAESEGFAAYLHKPIKASQLFDALVSVLAEQPIHVAPRPVARVEVDAEMGRRHPLRLLLAEDNVVNQKVALRLLGQLGYRADLASNGLEAVEAVARQTYDAVLMDVQMPELDGFGASREINRRWPGAARPRIVAMTANAMQGDRELCVAAGMDDYVAKPIRLEDLVAALERCPRRLDARSSAGNAPGGDRDHGGPAVAAGAGPAPQTAAGSGQGSAHGHGAAPGGAVGEPVIDRTVFEALTASMGGPLVAELIDSFVEDGRTLVADLRRGLAAADVDTFRRAAHSLKSNGETLGATHMAGLARELETMARAGRLEDAGTRVDPLAGAYERAARALEELRRGLPA